MTTFKLKRKFLEKFTSEELLVIANYIDIHLLDTKENLINYIVEQSIDEPAVSYINHIYEQGLG
jgi:hypothetical protein